MNELENYIKTYFDLSKEEIDQVTPFFKLIKLKKGDFFLKQGQYSERLGFVQTGILREFLYINGKEITKWVSTKGYFAVDLTSFLFGQRARVNYQALEDSELFTIDKEDFDRIEQVVPRWKELKTLFMAKCFVTLENRVIDHLSLSAEERYNRFFELNPSLFNQVQLQYIASILGMTPETFSRIRKKQLK